MAQHYGVTVMPARPRKPKDKAKVEDGVLIVQRWILARLRNRTFLRAGRAESGDLGAARGAERSAVPEARGLPESGLRKPRPARAAASAAVRYELAERKKARVNIDYHVEYDGRYYSVQYERVHSGSRCAPRRRSSKSFNAANASRRTVAATTRRGSTVTDPAHRPANHRDQVWPPERLIAWGASFGPAVAKVVEQMLARYVNPEQSYRACLGLMRTAERYGGASHERSLRTSAQRRHRRRPPAQVHRSDSEAGSGSESAVATATQRTSPLSTRTCAAATTTTERTQCIDHHRRNTHETDTNCGSPAWRWPCAS